MGILACLDGFMNIAMDQTEEYHPDESGGLGHLKAKYGDCFIRWSVNFSRTIRPDLQVRTNNMVTHIERVENKKS